MTSLVTIIQEIRGFINLSFIPADLHWTIYAGLMALGFFFMFFSRRTWKATILILGIIVTGYAMNKYGNPYVMPYLISIYPQTPSYLPPIVVGIAGGVIFSILVQLSVAAGVAYGTYMVGNRYLTMVQHYYIWALAAFAFLGGWLGYRKITNLIAKFIGVFTFFFGIALLGVSIPISAGVAIFLYVIAMAFTVDKNLKVKLKALLRRKVREEEIRKPEPPQPTPEPRAWRMRAWIHRYWYGDADESK